MIFKKVIMACCGVLVSLAMSGCAKSPVPPTTAKQVDLKRYAGTWYEIASFPNFFQKGCQCTTATYSLQGDNLKVLNQCYRGNPLKLSAANGKAWPVNTENTQLKVQFFWPFRGDYWILHIDPNYKVALVGSPKYNYLWILSRTPTISKQLYQQYVHIAQSKGYDTQKLVKTKQGCQTA